MQVTSVSSDNPKPLAHYTEAYVAGDLVFAAGQLATDFKTGIAASSRRHAEFPFYGSDIKLQTAFILEHLAKTFEAAGSSLDHVVKAQVFLTDLNDFAGFDEVWKSTFKTAPARTTIGTTDLLIKDALIEIDLIGYVPRPGLTIEKIKSNLPAPIAHYTEAFRVGPMIFAAGQLATDFKTGIPAEARKHPEFPFYGSNIKLQTDYILKNLAVTFAAAGSALDHVVKAQVFLTDLNDFAGFDEVWKTYFKVPPARTTIGTSGLLIKDALIEIDLIGHVPVDGRASTISQSDAPRPLAHYSEAHGVGDLVFAAGQFASDFKTGVPAEARPRSQLPILWVGHQTADALYPEEPGEDLRRQRLFPRRRDQGAGLPDGPRRLQRVRRGLEAIFQGPAGADHRGNDRSPGQGHARRDRSHRRETDIGAASDGLGPIAGRQAVAARRHRHFQALRRPGREPGRLARSPRRRNPRGPRRERRRQIDDHENHLRDGAAGRRHDRDAGPHPLDPRATRRDRGRDRHGSSAFHAGADAERPSKT